MHEPQFLIGHLTHAAAAAAVAAADDDDDDDYDNDDYIRFISLRNGQDDASHAVQVAAFVHRVKAH